MPNARRTAFGNVNVQTRVLARSKASTFIVSDEPVGTTQVMSRADYERMAALQDAYIAEQEMLLIEGYIGSDPAERTGARLYVEARTPTSPGCSSSCTSRSTTSRSRPS